MKINENQWKSIVLTISGLIFSIALVSAQTVRGGALRQRRFAPRPNRRKHMQQDCLIFQTE
jgi:hypothetical protein